MSAQVIAGRYEVLRAVGKGGMGTVWLCRDTVLEREVAVKRIGALPGEPAAAARAMREARIAASLNHPNAVAVFDVVDEDEAHWLVMEYVDGRSLAELVRDEGALPPDRVASMGAALARALARAHERGIVHRDLKPGNILVHRSGTPKVSDFGIARMTADPALTLTGYMTGTPGYLSPELARGGNPTPASDVWALGATLFHAVEGQSPFRSHDNPLAILQDILNERARPMERAGRLAPAIRSMMDPDPQTRWTMAQAADELDDLAAAGPPTAVLPVMGAADADADASADADANADDRVGGGVRAGEQHGTRAPAAVGDGWPWDELGRRDRDDDAGDDVPTVVRPSPSAGDSGGRRRWWPAAVVLVALLLAGTAYLLLRDPGPESTAQTPTSSSPAPTTSAPRPTSSSPTPTPSSPSPTRSTPTPSTPSPTRTSRTPTPSSSPSARAGTDAQLAAFARDYYAGVTSADGRDATWAMFTPELQARIGRSTYDGFWRTIESVRVSAVDADASDGTVTMQLRYDPRSGAPSTERRQWRVVRSGDSWLIAGDSRL
ncbi:serine/threonine protein kinase [Knoellia remsis]|uniref:non-specific serine/threonine protein kinase n=1 Tax=Knoellia remsis TaxID=407159 RepID=A0A2T0V0A6_9MICO|nr:serine/threonine-protein kinase [Knoellia remsis]PRY63619.1 serine/threonine protein kinase [Knoellia remsis]